MPWGNENSEAGKPKRSPGAVSHGPKWDGQLFLRRSTWPAFLVGRLTAAGGGEAKVAELPEAEQRGARVPLGTRGPPTWAPGLTLLVHAGHWGHTRLRPPRWPALAGDLRQREVCVCQGLPMCSHCPRRHRTRVCSSSLPPGGAWPVGLLAAAGLSHCGCRVTWAPETQRGGSARWQWLRAS